MYNIHCVYRYKIFFPRKKNPKLPLFPFLALSHVFTLLHSVEICLCLTYLFYNRRKELEELKVLLERVQGDKVKAEEVLQRAMAALKDDAAPIVKEKEKKENELIPLRQRVNQVK